MIRSLAKPIKNDTNGENGSIRRNLQKETLENLLKNGEAVWIDVSNPEEGEIEWLQQQCQLHPLVVEDLRRIDTRPSLLAYTDYIFLSLFQPSVSLKRVQAEEIHCIIGESYFITIRHSDTTAVDSAYERAAQNPNYWHGDVAYFLYLTIQSVVDSYYPIVDRISNQLNDLEEDLLSNKSEKTIRSIVYQLKQQLIAMRQMVAPQREVLSNVIGEERLARSNENRDLFRHLYERLMRVYDIIDSQRDLSNNVLDLIQSRESYKLSQAVNRLTIFSMIFLPLTFISGFFELNFITPASPLLIPLSGATLFFGIVITMVLVVSLMVWFFRRRGWL